MERARVWRGARGPSLVADDDGAVKGAAVNEVGPQRPARPGGVEDFDRLESLGVCAARLPHPRLPPAARASARAARGTRGASQSTGTPREPNLSFDHTFGRCQGGGLAAAVKAAGWRVG
jgi:hypothetical protein